MDSLGWIIVLVVIAVAGFGFWKFKQNKADAPKPSRTLHSSIAGVSVETELGGSPQQLIINLSQGDKLDLVAHDAGSDGKPGVEVCDRRKGHLGWLVEDITGEVLAALQSETRIECRVADITGGTRGNPAFGVSISIEVY